MGFEDKGKSDGHAQSKGEDGRMTARKKVGCCNDSVRGGESTSSRGYAFSGLHSWFWVHCGGGCTQFLPPLVAL